MSDNLKPNESSDLPILHLHVKDVYFQQIKDKSKPYEYRLRTDYWKKRLVGKSFKEIHIHSGYPKKGDKTKTVKRRWDGFREVKIAHEHFGLERVDVFAIRVRDGIVKTNNTRTNQIPEGEIDGIR